MLHAVPSPYKLPHDSVSRAEVNGAAEAVREGVCGQPQAGSSCRQVHLHSSIALPVLLAAWVSRDLIACLVASSSKSEGLWSWLANLCSAFSSLLKMVGLLKEPPSSSSESEFLLPGGDKEKGERGAEKDTEKDVSLEINAEIRYKISFKVWNLKHLIGLLVLLLCFNNKNTGHGQFIKRKKVPRRGERSSQVG